jgi:hypothetical protein
MAALLVHPMDRREAGGAMMQNGRNKTAVGAECDPATDNDNEAHHTTVRDPDPTEDWGFGG